MSDKIGDKRCIQRPDSLIQKYLHQKESSSESSSAVSFSLPEDRKIAGLEIQNYVRNNPQQHTEWFITYTKELSDWLADTSKLRYTEKSIKLGGKLLNSHYWYYKSPETELGEEIPGKIFLITQFYIDNNKSRQAEIRKCLRLNVSNKNIDKIYLLNERKYSEKELGIKSDKICQIIIKKRLSYKRVFDIIEDHQLDGYIVLTNSDIFFDASILQVKKCQLSTEKKVYALLRHEYEENKSLKSCSLFGPRGDSQDVWIFHSSQNMNKEHRILFDFHLGVPACDNKIAYLWNILGYQCYNEPNLLKCYHHHTTKKRNYTNKTTRPAKPWVAILPKLDFSTYY